MQEFTVKVKDRQQDITHQSTVLARTQRTANRKFIEYLRDSFGHTEFELL